MLIKRNEENRTVSYYECVRECRRKRLQNNLNWEPQEKRREANHSRSGKLSFNATEERELRGGDWRNKQLRKLEAINVREGE